MDDPQDGAPVVTEVTFKINDEGDLFAIEFLCLDGGVRSVAMSTAALKKLIAGALWTAAEAGARSGAPPAQAPRARAQLLGSAPHADAASASFLGGGLVMELRVGVAPIAFKLPREAALSLAEGLVDALHARTGA